MSSTFSHSGSLDRKELKRPDDFVGALRRIFDSLAQNYRVFATLLVVFLLLGGVAVYFTTRQDAKSELGRSALFLAKKSLEADLRVLVPKPVAKDEKPKDLKSAVGGKETANKAAEKKAEEPLPETLFFKKLDVDKSLSNSVQKLKAISDEYKGTRAAYEAQSLLGSLYFNHGEAQKSLDWLQKAQESAPTVFDRAISWNALGQAKEMLGKTDEALQAYEKALGLGEGSIKGEVLLAMARVYASKNDLAKARSTYDQIITQLPNTEHSRSAEMQKSLLE